MIAYINGFCLIASATEIILRTDSGVGYSVVRPIQDFIANEGKSYEYWVYHHITDQGQVLFGFNRPESRRLAIELMEVDGIGARTAHRLATAVDPAVIIDAVAKGDVAKLSKLAKGFGPTGAKKLVDTLQSRFQSKDTLGYDTKVSAVFAVISNLGLGARFDIAEIRDAVTAAPDLTAQVIAQNLIGKARK